MEVSYELEVLRREIPVVFENEPDMSSGEALNLVKRMYPSLIESKGISPYIELSLAQVEDLVVVRKTSLSVYMLAGALGGACGMALISLFILKGEEEDAYLVE
jgi:hypothetical protein